MRWQKDIAIFTLAIVLVASSATPLAAAPFTNRTDFADPRFAAVWNRTDNPTVRGGRSWYWGPEPWFDYAEFYHESPNGLRTVQYFDKARMEINNPADGIVTNGLLVVELVSGQMQIGDYARYRYRCSDVPVAGNPRVANPVAPGYCQFIDRATFDDLFRPPYRDPVRLNERVSATLYINGQVGERADLARSETTIVQYNTVTGHNIPRVFWDFMTMRGRVVENGRVVTAPIVDWLFAVGHPITDPYWVRAVVGDTERDVLVQLFERRVLTYTPDNPSGYQVEMGNVGQHYFQWRYPHLGAPWVSSYLDTPLIYASNVDTGSHWELYRASFTGGQRLTFNNGETVAYSWRRSWDPHQQMLLVDSRRAQPDYRQIYALNSYAANEGEQSSNASATRISQIDFRDALSGSYGPPSEFLDRIVNEFNPMVSPDGVRILVISERTGRPDLNLWTMPDMNNQPPITWRLTRDLPACRYETPGWSPDGRMIFWVSDCTGDFEVYSAELAYRHTSLPNRRSSFLVELTNIRNLTNHSGSDRFARVSPDGRTIAFASDRNGNWEIYVMNVDGSNLRQLTNNVAVDDAPTWSPDGSQLAFASNRDGDFEIYILNVSDGSIAQQVTWNAAQDRWPLWAQ
ncbi:TolB family protein [Chloroflexus sp.]|uniref:TolB family protein n=1 Tax=Chloroflexus sp. TaxID=1904827 RepID=UPI002602B812|nr:hypothetical protein [uncultured Chloroflexus sp.]